MKYPLIAALVVFSLFLLLQNFVLEAVLVFLLTGIIPGTTFALPPGLMLFGLGGSLALFIYWVIRKEPVPVKRMPRRKKALNPARAR